MGLPDMLDMLTGLAQISPPDISPLPKTSADSGRIRTVLTVIFSTLGAISVMMIVIGGIKYSGSQGDPQGVSKAKGTIIYAIVGLIVAILAVSLVDFVLGRVA